MCLIWARMLLCFKLIDVLFILLGSERLHERWLFSVAYSDLCLDKGLVYDKPRCPYRPFLTLSILYCVSMCFKSVKALPLWWRDTLKFVVSPETLHHVFAIVRNFRSDIKSAPFFHVAILFVRRNFEVRQGRGRDSHQPSLPYSAVEAHGGAPP